MISNVVFDSRGACGRQTQRDQDAAFIRHVFPNAGQHGDRCTHGDGITGFDQSPPQNGLFFGFDVDIRLLGFHRGDGRARGDGAAHRRTPFEEDDFFGIGGDAGHSQQARHLSTPVRCREVVD